jgi:hypothetical protein
MHKIFISINLTIYDLYIIFIIFLNYQLLKKKIVQNRFKALGLAMAIPNKKKFENYGSLDEKGKAVKIKKKINTKTNKFKKLIKEYFYIQKVF